MCADSHFSIYLDLDDAIIAVSCGIGMLAVH